MRCTSRLATTSLVMMTAIGLVSCGQEPPRATTQAQSTSASAAPSPSDSFVDGGFSAAQRETMLSLVTEVRTDKHITRVALQDSGPAGTTPGSTDWLALASDSITQADRVKARWEARILVAAYWRTRLEAADSHLPHGGLLQFDTSTGVPGLDTAPILIPEGASKDPSAVGMYQDENNQLSPLVIDRGGLESHIRETARADGLDIKTIQFFKVLGDNVAITAVAADPVAFLTKHPNYYELTGDPGRLEGVYILIQDSSGQIVRINTYATGLATGEGGVGDGYSKVVPSRHF